MLNQPKYHRDGTSQAQRLIAALQKNYISLDERTISDWLRFAQEYAKELRYYNFENKIDGDWSGFPVGNVDEMIAFLENPEAFSNQPNKTEWFSRPHFVLFIIFLKLLNDYHKEALNGLLQRHLDYYYRQILQFRRKPARPDQVFLMVELAKNYKKDRFLFQKGAETFAGKDDTGKDLIYRTDENLMINRAQVAELKTVFVNRQVDSLETYDLSEPFTPMLQLALGVTAEGDVTPGGNLPGIDFLTKPNEPDDHFFEETVLPFLRFTPDTLRMSFASLRKLMVMKIERDNDQEDWNKVNDLMAGLKNGTTPSGRNFIANFLAATGFHPLPNETTEDNVENVFKDLQNVNSIYELYEEINLASSGDYYTFKSLGMQESEYADFSRLQSLKIFVNEKFYPANDNEPKKNENVNNFQEMMQWRYDIREAWIEIWALLANNPELKTAKVDLEEPNYQKKFNALLASAYQEPIDFSKAYTDITSIDDYYTTLTNDQAHSLNAIEPYFGLRAEEILIILEFVFNKLGDRKRVDELLIKAHKSKLPEKAAQKAPEKIALHGLYAYPDATILKTGAEDEKYQRWQTFGAPDSSHLANLGLAIRSPILALSEGIRTITIDIFATDNLIQEQIEALKVIGTLDENERPVNPYKIQVSGEKEWLDVIVFKTLNFNEDDKKLTIEFELDADFDPILPLPKDAEGYLGSLPAVRILVDKPQLLLNDITVHDLFSQFTIKEVNLFVNVQELLPSAIRNDAGEVKAEEPFDVFGVRPKAGSSLYFTHPELINKKLDSVTLKGDWMGAPSTLADLTKYYNGYPDGKNKHTDFKAKLQLLARKKVIHETGTLALFGANATNDGLKLPDNTEITFSEETGYEYETLETVELSDKVFENQRYLALKLDGTDFGHSVHPVLASEMASKLAVELTKYAKGDRLEDSNGTQKNTPPDASTFQINPPYTPQLQNFSITYEASAKGLGSEDSARQAELIHIHPFGYGQYSGQTFLPFYPHEGYLYIGIKDLNPPFDLTLLFQMAEGSADPDLEPPQIDWRYLVGDNWVYLTQKGRLVSDGTNGLLNSGIIKLRIPEEIDTEHKVLPSDLYWLRASVKNNSTGLSNTIAIHTQAVSATFENRDNDPNHLNQPLPAESITKLRKAQAEIKGLQQPYSSFGGAPIEPLERLNTRASERLRHKNRALTIWDYERLVLEAFPQVFKVKSMLGEYLNDGLGTVLMVAVPNIIGIRPFDPFEPKLPRHQLRAIEAYLQQRAAPCTKIIVKNPVYIQLKIRMSVELYASYQSDGKYYMDLLHQSLLKFLAPWAFDQGTEIPIGGKIYPSLIVDFVERLEYVDYVKDYRIIYGEKGGLRPATDREMQEGLIAPRPDAIWVSAKEHLLTTTGTSGVGVGYMIVENDFQIA